MKSPRLLTLAFGFILALGSLRAADPAAAWRAADDARIAAMVSADAKQLDVVFSDDLLYVHSNGKPDTKATFIPAITSGKSVYRSVTYEQRDFREVAPGLVHMTGRCRVQLGKTAPYNELYLSVLAAYRLEKGVWRFLAWQSAKLTEPVPAKK
ncbi:MAG: nuclear transport factor 2 family protein [Opitutaceae bacterium]|nr:nuclear transport factor 2 family protein [Opitutaceae bacterium]